MALVVVPTHALPGVTPVPVPALGSSVSAEEGEEGLVDVVVGPLEVPKGPDAVPPLADPKTGSLGEPQPSKAELKIDAPAPINRSLPLCIAADYTTKSVSSPAMPGSTPWLFWAEVG